jgi:hypothetical protein
MTHTRSQGICSSCDFTNGDDVPVGRDPALQPVLDMYCVPRSTDVLIFAARRSLSLVPWQRYGRGSGTLNTQPRQDALHHTLRYALSRWRKNKNNTIWAIQLQNIAFGKYSASFCGDDWFNPGAEDRFHSLLFFLVLFSPCRQVPG